jgi:hypothetical protein
LQPNFSVVQIISDYFFSNFFGNHKSFQAYNKLLADKKEANAKKTEERRQRHLQEQARLIQQSQVGYYSGVCLGF